MRCALKGREKPDETEDREVLTGTAGAVEPSAQPIPALPALHAVSQVAPPLWILDSEAGNYKAARCGDRLNASTVTAAT